MADRLRQRDRNRRLRCHRRQLRRVLRRHRGDRDGVGDYEFILGAGGWPYGDIPAWVFSSRELAPIEGADLHFVRGAVAPVHQAMVAAAGERDVWLVGGGGLAVAFAGEGLLDELRLTVVPVVLGSGIPAFAGRLRDRLVLSGTRTFRNGMVELRYGLER